MGAINIFPEAASQDFVIESIMHEASGAVTITIHISPGHLSCVICGWAERVHVDPLRGDDIARTTEPSGVAPTPTQDELIADFCNWWDAHREGSPNAAYLRVNRFVKDMRAALSSSRSAQ